MTKPKARLSKFAAAKSAVEKRVNTPRKPIPSTREAVVMERQDESWRETPLREAMKKVEQCEEAVADSRSIVDTYKRQIADLERSLHDVTGYLADAQGILVAKEQKLSREMEKLRSVTYQMESKSARAWEVNKISLRDCEAKAQCERNY